MLHNFVFKNNQNLPRIDDSIMVTVLEKRLC